MPEPSPGPYPATISNRSTSRRTMSSLIRAYRCVVTILGIAALRSWEDLPTVAPPALEILLMALLVSGVVRETR